MNRDAYLKDATANEFVGWSANLVTGEWGLHHSWTGKQSDISNFNFRCESLYEAYTRYYWNGDFEHTANLMDGFKREFQEAIDGHDRSRFSVTAEKVMDWGGIIKYDRLKSLGSHALEVLTIRALLSLDPRHADTDKLTGFWPMGSGYSKIYSLILDDFPIYDSRVACAQTSLIRLFCKDTGRPGVPECLKLAIPPHLGPKERNTPGFPRLNYSQDAKYADSNLKAAWLLGAQAKVDGSKFDSVPSERRVLALQSALFMLGYRTLDDDAVKK